MAYRFAIIIVAVFAAYFFLGFHLYQLQLTKGDYYFAKAQAEIAAAQDTSANRGAIYFTTSDGTLPPATITGFPGYLRRADGDRGSAGGGEHLAPILDMPVSTLTSIFSRPNDSYELLVRKADSAAAQKITDLNMKGVYADFEPDRFYPLGTVAAQVLGFVGPNATNNGESGHYGIEEFYDGTLARRNTTITLTIDPNIQIEAEKIWMILWRRITRRAAASSWRIRRRGKFLRWEHADFDPNNYAVVFDREFFESDGPDRLRTRIHFQSAYDGGRH